MKMRKKSLDKNEIELLDKYFRACNYLSAAQLYLLDNPLLKEKLTMDHIKPKIVGHWGTTPGQNFIYTHLNRIINKYDLNINWETDTKDEGGHLNYFGALKASEVLGNILKDTNLLVDHRGDKNYKLWDTAYLRYKEEVNK